jgi:hypothetical protein
MLLLIESGWDVKALGAEARDFGLRLIHCEVIGGYDLLAPKDGVPYGALVASVIAGEKALARRYPMDAPDWPSFVAYANSGEFPNHLHTQSHFIAYCSELGSEAT